MLIDVVKVVPHPDFTLELEYANGERRRFDATPLLAVRPWTGLGVWPLFRCVRVQHGVVTWPGGLDIAPETLYDCSTPIELEVVSIDVDTAKQVGEAVKNGQQVLALLVQTFEQEGKSLPEPGQYRYALA